MERFDMQVMLKDGSFADYEVMNDNEKPEYEIWQKDNRLATFTAQSDGNWVLTDNPGDLDADLQQRIINQLNGYRR